ncbi:phosphatidylserine decarboxylase family protein [Trinickia mobilis]|uniref:phosphatidylserine decarboxylase family protein n=1 Tax=Trinickia mobilis TaxID=2816356 RepID=UPI001A8F1CFB|nr:phosphatidylserine decarboxylase family protein [Trinickia mobilis]
MNAKSNPPLDTRRRLGYWLPADESVVANFRKRIAAQAKDKQVVTPLLPVVQELATLVNEDPVLRMGFTQAIDEALARGYKLHYSTIDELMVLINHVMTYAPPFDTTELVGCPLNALLDWPMCMPAGFALFRSPALNAQFKRVLNFWCSFLSGPYSRTYLNTTAPNGWFCPEALKATDMSQFRSDPAAPYWGFASWNGFFTREFLPGARPVADPSNHKVIVNACESTPYHLRHDVKLQDRFWIKAQPYSLQDIFTAQHEDLAQKFVGGDVYQAFLSAYNYHRWHAPVSGTVVKAYLVDGTYYSDAESEGLDPAGPNDSQGYITAVAARAVLVIDCDDPAIGLVGCVFVGMAEISSCVVEALPGTHVKKGDEIGYFQYGGSTHCLIFRPGVIQRFVPKPPFNFNAPPIKINTQIATAN